MLRNGNSLVIYTSDVQATGTQAEKACMPGTNIVICRNIASWNYWVQNENSSLTFCVFLLSYDVYEFDL